MLLETDIKFLNELRQKNKSAYERKLRILGISDEDVPYREVKIASNSIFDEVHYMGGSPYVGPPNKTNCTGLKNIILKKENRSEIKLSAPKAKHKTKKSIKIDLYIDAENIGAKHADKIIQRLENKGSISNKNYYGRQKDEAIKPWKEKAKKYGIKPVLVSKEPEKDKVDKKIKKDIQASLSNGTCVDLIAIATSDGGYIDIVKKVREAGKKVIIIGEEKTPEELRNAANDFWKI